MSSVANQKLDGNKIPEPVVHTISAVGYFDSLKRHGRGQFWTSETEGLSGIPAWRDHIKELTVPARRRKCQAFLQAVLTCFYQVDIWCDDSSEISLTPEQEEIQLAIYKRGLDSSIEVFCLPSHPSPPQMQSLLLTSLRTWAPFSMLSSANAVKYLISFSQKG